MDRFRTATGWTNSYNLIGRKFSDICMDQLQPQPSG